MRSAKGRVHSQLQSHLPAPKALVNLRAISCMGTMPTLHGSAAQGKHQEALRAENPGICMQMSSTQQLLKERLERLAGIQCEFAHG